jgi:hypothetical protein
MNERQEAGDRWNSIPDTEEFGELWREESEGKREVEIHDRHSLEAFFNESPVRICQSGLQRDSLYPIPSPN